jgi:two-component system, NtrC family, sensor kinase
VSRRPRTSPRPAATSESRRTPIGASVGAIPKKPELVEREIPPSWLDRLLAASAELPIEQGPEAVASALVEAIADLLPELALGISMSEGSRDSEGAGWVVRRARQSSSTNLSPRSKRLFPELTHERVLAAPGADVEFRLHIACDDATAVADESVSFRFLKRVMDVLSGALRTTRLVSAKGRESLELKGQIIQSEKLASLGQIAAGVVHELNNPLTSIVGYAEYLKNKAERENRDPNDIERLRRIADAAGRILRFSRDLMTYARPSMERPAPVAVHAVIDQALVFCEHVLDRTDIVVERLFASNIRPVLGVRDQLTQVFVNLFTNACHAMQDGKGRLSIQTELDMKMRTVRVRVSDTGHGIGEGDLRRIFDPFFTTKSEGHGTGLGLSIVRNIVLLHGGVIEVESKLREGTTFRLELPIAP